MTDEAPAAAEPQPIDAEPLARTPLVRRPLFWIIVGVIVVIIAGVSVFAATRTSPNATACKLYGDAYNGMADPIRTSDGSAAAQTAITAGLDAMPASIGTALAHAHGDVATQMSKSFDLAKGYVGAKEAGADTRAVGISFFLSTRTVYDACSADGASITLDDLK